MPFFEVGLCEADEEPGWPGQLLSNLPENEHGTQLHDKN